MDGLLDGDLVRPEDTLPAESVAEAPVTRSDALAELQQEVTRQRQDIADLETQLAALSKPNGRWTTGLMPTLLALILITAVGVAGILLPRRAEPGAQLLVEIASLYQAAGETEDAIRVLDEAVDVGIRDAETLGRAGKMYRLLRQFEKAVSVLEEVVEKEPENEEYRLSLAQSYGGNGQHQEAIAQYEALIERDPANVWYYAEMGHRYKSLGDYDQALIQYRKMLEVDPAGWRAYHYQAEVLRALEKGDEAIAQYQRALEIYPDYYWSWLNCGLRACFESYVD